MKLSRHIMIQLYNSDVSLNDSDSIGNIQCIVVFAQSHISLLLPSWCDQSVDLLAFDAVEVLHGLLDLALVGLNVNNEHKSIAVFNQFHGRFRGKRVFNDRVLVECVLLASAETLVFGLARK